jgi:hypothetical protein
MYRNIPLDLSGIAKVSTKKNPRCHLKIKIRVPGKAWGGEKAAS